MSRADRSFRAAQAAYDAAELPEGAGECPACEGRGYELDEDDLKVPCERCDGDGEVRS